ncbi:unnamed protein product, partial [Pylaiella littoralis]
SGSSSQGSAVDLAAVKLMSEDQVWRLTKEKLVSLLHEAGVTSAKTRLVKHKLVSMLRCVLTGVPDTDAGEGAGANQQSVSPAADEIGGGGSEVDEASGGGGAAAAEAGPSGEKDTGNVNGNAL